MFTKPRVLIVDDEIAWRSDHAETVEELGYQPVIAEGQGDKLIADAKRKCEEMRCHVTIVDLRLRNNTDPKDISGIDEIVSRLPIPNHIIVSGYPDSDQTDTLRTKYKNLYFVSKARAAERLPSKLKELVKSKSSIERNLKVELQPSINHKFKEFCDYLTIDEESVKDILTELDTTAIACELLPIDASPATPSVTLNRNSFVCRMRIQGNLEKEFIIKIARSEKIEIENVNYRSFIEKGLQNERRYASIASIGEDSGVVLSYQIGGIRFNKVVNAQTFSYIYCQSSIADEIWRNKIKKIIDSYTEGWSHYKTKDFKSDSGVGLKLENESLLNIYLKVWDKGKVNPIDLDDKNSNNTIFEARLKKKCQTESKILEHRGYKDKFKNLLFNPLIWLRDCQNHLKSKNNIYTQITHGDLWGENLFVGDEDAAIVIDFERTGRGYELQDFVQLEFDILTRLIALDHKDEEDWRLLHHLYTAIISNNDLTQDVAFKSPNNEIKKAIFAVNAIRNAARNCANDQKKDTQQYLYAMLLNCAFRATIDTPKADFEWLDNEKQQIFSTVWLNERYRALLLGALIINKITAKKIWPPHDWPQYQSLSIREALIEGGVLSQVSMEIVERICFQVGFDHENLSGSIPLAKLRDLYQKAKNQFEGVDLSTLLQELKNIYPTYDWRSD